MVVENAILIRYYQHTPKQRALIESTDGPTGRPADNQPYSDWLGVYHGTIPKLTVRIIDNPDLRFGNGSGWTRARTQSDGPEPLPTLRMTLI